MRLQMILSILAGWGLLGVLIAGLGLIFQTLQCIRRSLEQIAMGVRAIEQQTSLLGTRAEALTLTLSRAAETVDAAAGHLVDVERDLDIAAPALRRR